MRLSTLTTMTIPTAGAVREKNAEIASALDGMPLRVKVRIRGPAGAEAIFAFSKAVLAQVPTDETLGGGMNVPVDEEEIFYLAPTQRLYAAGTVAGVQVSFHASEIRPTMS